MNVRKGRDVTSEQSRDDHCNECLGTRRHRFTVTRNREQGAIEKRTVWHKEFGKLMEAPYRTVLREVEVVECCGCGELHWVVRKTREKVEPDWEAILHGADSPPDGQILLPDRLIDERRYPPLVHRKMPSWAQIFDHEGKVSDSASMPKAVPYRVRALLVEVYDAIAINANSLAAMGIRAIIDGTCNDKVGDCGGFEQNLKALVDGEFISSRDRDILSTVVEMGHAATHRGHQPAISDVADMLDVVENMLTRMYRAPMQAARLRERTPHRKSNKK